MKKNEVTIASVMMMAMAVISDQMMKFAMGMEDFVKNESADAVQFILTEVPVMIGAYLIPNIAVGVILIVLVVSVIVHMNQLIKEDRFPPVLMLAIVSGGLISLLIDVFYFGGIRHWFYFSENFGTAIADVYIVTGLILFFVVRKYGPKPVESPSNLSVEQ